jgi:AraC-like DNA-binding protein
MNRRHPASRGGGPRDNYAERPSVAVAYPRLLLAMLAERGHSTAEAAEEAGVDRALLDRPEAMISGAAYARLIAHALRVTRDPCLGCELGLRMPPTMHSVLGALLVCADTLGDALAQGARFFVLASQVIALRTDFASERPTISIDEILPLGAVRQFVVESGLVGLYRAGELLTMLTVAPRGLELSFTWPEPPAFRRYRARLPPAQFGQPFNQLRCPTSLLERPLPLANALARRRAIRDCERALSEIPEHGAPLVARVYQALGAPEAAGYAALAQVAALLGVSPRTLSRRLAASGTSFSALLDGRRISDARSMLAESDVAVAAVARHVGYTDAANFARAFRKQTRESPSAFRARAQASARVSGLAKGSLHD